MRVPHPSKWKLPPLVKENHKLTWRHPQVGHAKTKKTRKCIKMSVIDLLLHLHKRIITPTTKKAKRKNKKMKRMFHPDPSKISHVLEQEYQEIILLNKSSMIFKPGESHALKHA